MNELAAPTRSRPPWFRFSLRSLLVVVTVFCVWLGWEIHIVRGRQQALRWVKDRGGWYSEALPVTAADYICSQPARDKLREALNRTSISSVRGWFGDKAIFEIHMPNNATNADGLRITSLFPGTKVNASPGSSL